MIGTVGSVPIREVGRPLEELEPVDPSDVGEQLGVRLAGEGSEEPLEAPGVVTMSSFAKMLETLLRKEWLIRRATAARWRSICGCAATRGELSAGHPRPPNMKISRPDSLVA